MAYPKLKPPTKAEIEASNISKMKRSIRIDIRKIDVVLQNNEELELMELHKFLDGKYQSAICDWGKSMYAYLDKVGFSYELLDEASLKHNLEIMKAKLEAFEYGWNAVEKTRKPSVKNPDVNVFVNNNLNINITFEQVRANIEDMTSLTEEQTKEALQKVSEIEEIVNCSESKKVKWEKVKPILVWLTDKSFDMAMMVIPLLLKLQA